MTVWAEPPPTMGRVVCSVLLHAPASWGARGTCLVPVLLLAAQLLGFYAFKQRGVGLGICFPLLGAALKFLFSSFH